MKELKDNNRCFVCGKENPHGLHIDFEINEKERSLQARYTPQDHHQGYEGIVHGGILSTLLDEAMAKLAFNLGLHVVTAEITVKFKAPANTGEELSIFGKLVEENKRLVLAEAKITRGTVVIAEATGKLLRV
ncbi:MAG: PaaI family thioesterase [Nitrospirota bacterium]